MILFLGAFIILLCLSAPITVALGGCSMVYALVGGTVPITTLIQTIFGGLATFPLLAIPLFMLAGNLMKEGGLTPDLVNFTRLLLGHIRGGLGQATILACAIFAAISGAAVATAVAIGVVMIPAMKKAGYDEGTAAALTGTAACVPPLITPGSFSPRVNGGSSPASRSLSTSLTATPPNTWPGPTSSCYRPWSTNRSWYARSLDGMASMTLCASSPRPGLTQTPKSETPPATGTVPTIWRTLSGWNRT